MPERAHDAERGLRIYSIAAHRGFADALVAGLIPRYAEPDLGLARLTLLLLIPSVRTSEIPLRDRSGSSGTIAPWKS